MNGKNPGQQSPFNIGRLTISIAESFVHEPQLGKSSAFDLAQTIETKLLSETKTRLTTFAIIDRTYSVLSRFDKKAAVQYALRHHYEIKI